MRKSWLLALAATGLLVAPVLAAQSSDPGKAEPKNAEGEAEHTGLNWETDYQKALDRAKEEKKRLFIEFTASW